MEPQVACEGENYVDKLFTNTSVLLLKKIPRVIQLHDINQIRQADGN